MTLPKSLPIRLSYKGRTFEISSWISEIREERHYWLANHEVVDLVRTLMSDATMASLNTQMEEALRGPAVPGSPVIGPIVGGGGHDEAPRVPPMVLRDAQMGVVKADVPLKAQVSASLTSWLSSEGDVHGCYSQANLDPMHQFACDLAGTPPRILAADSFWVKTAEFIREVIEHGYSWRDAREQFMCRDHRNLTAEAKSTAWSRVDLVMATSFPKLYEALKLRKNKYIAPLAPSLPASSAIDKMKDPEHLRKMIEEIVKKNPAAPAPVQTPPSDPFGVRPSRIWPSSSPYVLGDDSYTRPLPDAYCWGGVISSSSRRTAE